MRSAYKADLPERWSQRHLVTGFSRSVAVVCPAILEPDSAVVVEATLVQGERTMRTLLRHLCDLVKLDAKPSLRRRSVWHGIAWMAMAWVGWAAAQNDLATTASLPNAYITMDLMLSGGQAGDGTVLTELLAELGYMPDGAAPRIVRLRSIDSGWPDVEYGWERDLWTVIVHAAVEFGAPPPLIVLSPQSSEASRQANGSLFPSTPEALAATGFDWLVQPDGFEILWDMEARIADRIARHWLMFGVEEIDPLAMTLCAAQGGVTGWARSYHLNRPSLASVGRFVDECTRGDLELYTDYSIPQATREEYGLTGGPFALLLPWAGYEHVAGAVALAERTLGAPKVGIPMRVVATEAVTDVAGSRFVTRGEHAELLEEAGIAVDVGLSEVMPAWVDGLATPRASLLLFDAGGELIGSYYAFGIMPPDIETLSQGLLRLGLLH